MTSTPFRVQPQRLYLHVHTPFRVRQRRLYLHVLLTLGKHFTVTLCQPPPIIGFKTAAAALFLCPPHLLGISCSGSIFMSFTKVSKRSKKVRYASTKYITPEKSFVGSKTVQNTPEKSSKRPEKVTYARKQF